MRENQEGPALEGNEEFQRGPVSESKRVERETEENSSEGEGSEGLREPPLHEGETPGQCQGSKVKP